MSVVTFIGWLTILSIFIPIISLIVILVATLIMELIGKKKGP